MTIQQLSVFIENKSGTLQKVLNLLKEAGIQLIASTIADTVEYGIYRIICSEPKRAYETLKEAGISVALSDVFAITLDNQPGRAADAITIFSEAQIGITYLYSFLLGNKGILIFRTDNPDRAREVIILNGIKEQIDTLVITEFVAPVSHIPLVLIYLPSNVFFKVTGVTIAFNKLFALIVSALIFILGKYYS